MKRPELTLLLLLVSQPALAQGWQAIYGPANPPLTSVCFPTPTTGYAKDDYGGFEKTTDGGLTWFRLYPNIQMGTVFFIDADTGYDAVVNGTVGKTTDGGTTWDTIFTSPTTASGIAFTDPRHGYIVGGHGTILQTTDAGSTWQPYITGAVEWLTGVAFADSMNGIAVGGGDLFRTTNGGLTWTGRFCPKVSQLDFIDSATAIAVGTSGIMLRTTDRGISWTSGMLDSTIVPVRVTRISPGVAMIAGYYRSGSLAGAILKTTDAGVTWFEQPISSQNALTSIAAPSPSSIFVCGYGSVYWTGDGGGPYMVTLLSPSPGFVAHQPAMPLRWRSIPGASRYRVTVSLVPDFAPSLTEVDTTTADTSYVASGLIASSLYFWRVQTTDGAQGGPWSRAWQFGTAPYPDLAVRAIQEVAADSLALADSLQGNAPMVLQASPLRGAPGVNIRAVCVIPPGTLIDRSDGSPLAVVADVSSPDTVWRGIVVNAAHSPAAAEFARVERGDMLALSGYIVEVLSPSAATMTTLMMREFRNDGPGVGIPPPPSCTIADFHTGPYAGGKTSFSGGERFEGEVVELHGVYVHSVIDAADGTVNLSDGRGNTMPTTDISKWFTLSERKAGGFTLPPIGALVDTVRGVIVTETKPGSPPVYKIAPVMPGDIVYGERRLGKIRGRVVDDFFRDSTKLWSELGTEGWEVHIAGKVEGTIRTGGSGVYSFDGLDSGTYVVTQEIRPRWTPTYPPGVSYVVTLGVNDSTPELLFGDFFPWNRVSGTVFHDMNENGRRDQGEPGLSGILVRYDGSLSETARTDSSGVYLLQRVDAGATTVTLAPDSGWELSLPRFGGGYSLDIRTFNELYDSLDFGLHTVAFRIRNTVHVHDNTVTNGRDVWWGLRAGASYGIWGADSTATNIDFSEGEVELPPPTEGVFDARFVDPRGSIRLFGYGSWTDMRDVGFKTAADTFRLTFQPGYFFGGDFPMTISWNRAQMTARYLGPVSLAAEGEGGEVVDMKLRDSLVVTDPAIGSVRIIAAEPLLPAAVGSPTKDLPRAFSLSQNYPNPFNPATRIRYALPERSVVRLAVYDVLGRMVALLADGVQEAGERTVAWDAETLPSGVYFCRLQAGGAVAVRKLLLLR